MSAVAVIDPWDSPVAVRSFVCPWVHGLILAVQFETRGRQASFGNRQG